MFLEILKQSIFTMVLIVGMYFIFGYMYQIIERKSDFYIRRTFGLNGLLITGIGTVIHEFSHYLMCKMFGHRVVEVKLFRPFKFREDGILGYVRHSYNPNSLIQRVGTFFVGIAPMMGGTLFILLILIVLYPSIYRDIEILISASQTMGVLEIIEETLDIFYKNIFNLNNITDIKFWIFIYLATSISLHMSLSRADLENAKEGLWYIFISIIIFNFMIYVLNLDVLNMFEYILLYNSIVFIVLIWGLIFSLIGLLFSYMLYKIKKVVF